MVFALLSKIPKLLITLIITPYINVDDVTDDLQVSAEKPFRWFTNNQMKENTDKCQLIMSTNNA